MTDQSTYGGLFQDPPYLSSDPDPQKSDPYDKQEFIPSRYLGKSMMTGGAACPGQHPDAYFDKQYLTLASAEQNAEVYAANDKLERRRAAAAAKNARKPVSESEFRYTSYPAKSTGPGSYYGCFQSRPYEYDVVPAATATKQERKRLAKREKAAAAAAAEEKRIRALPNIQTNPPKKGTYGVPGVLLSNEAYNDNWRAEFEAAENRRKKAAAAAAAAESKPVGAPFRVSGVNKAYLDELPATGVPGVYSAYTPPEEVGKKRRGKRADAPAAAAAQSMHEKPFVGGHLHGVQQGCFSPYPNTWVDPATEEAAARKKSENQRNAAGATPGASRPKGAGEWKPNSFNRTSVISSCLRRFY